MKRDPLWMVKARNYIGTREIPGGAANPQIVKWLSLTTLPHDLAVSDETAWCAAFVEGMLEEAGLVGTKRANARSYERYGEEISAADARRGDICVLWRGSRDSASGHVGFVEGFSDRGVVLLAGNQGNAVGYQHFDFDRVVCYRRPIVTTEGD